MWVGLGGGLGSVLRWWIGRLLGEAYKGHFPLGTFLINVSGSLVIGYLSVLFNVDWHNRHGHGVVLNAFRPDPAMWLVPLAMIALGALAGLVPAFKAYRTDVASNLTPLS